MSIEIDFKNCRRNAADNFGCQLFKLLFKADPNNLEKLRLGFPEHVAYLELFRSGGIPDDE